MSQAARVPGLVLIGLGLLCAAEASTFEVAFMTDPVGPKALPYLVAVVLVLTGAHATLRPPAGGPQVSRPALARIGGAIAAFLVYAGALPALGFFTATTLVVSTLSWLFGATATRAGGAAAILSGVLWVLFVYVLGLPLPIGELWIR